MFVENSKVATNIPPYIRIIDQLQMPVVRIRIRISYDDSHMTYQSIFSLIFFISIQTRA